MKSIRFLIISLILYILASTWILYPDSAISGPYLNSAHGSSSYGVKRSATGFPTDYPKGLCAHCHEQHASINNSEPYPTGGPDKYLLFYASFVSQTDNFCLKCHTDVSSYQSGGSITNRSYSYRAGGYTSDTLNDILEAFNNNTSHNLNDIKNYISGNWGYTNDSNPCLACHNPHSAQGDPANSPNSAKSSGTRGWPVSRPSQHSKNNNTWGLWGDASSERMSNYTANYQAPYRYNSTTAYEPDGSSTQDGSNLTDFVTFCRDCHANQISSSEGTRAAIDWSSSGDKHGNRNAADQTNNLAPYTDISGTRRYVLACTDCHEPHGSGSYAYLIRQEVNGATTSVTGNTGSAWKTLCDRCHNTPADRAEHQTPFSTPCINCHKHGSTSF